MSHSGFSDAFDHIFLVIVLLIVQEVPTIYFSVHLKRHFSKRMEIFVKMRIRSSRRSFVTLIRLGTFLLDKKMPPRHPKVFV